MFSWAVWSLPCICTVQVIQIFGKNIYVHIWALPLELNVPRYPLSLCIAVTAPFPILCFFQTGKLRSSWGLATDSGLPLGADKQTEKTGNSSSANLFLRVQTALQFQPAFCWFLVPSDGCFIHTFSPFPRVYSCYLQKSCSDRSCSSITGNWKTALILAWRF